MNNQYEQKDKELENKAQELAEEKNKLALI